MSEQHIHYRVKFQEKDEKQVTTVVVKSFSPSEILGLVTLSEFVFKDQTKFVVLPEEDEARKRFGKTERLHIPYHCLLSVEEFFDKPVDLKKLPFIKEVASEDSLKSDS